ncbi:cell division protein ZipA [Shewanella halifaxensis HAW-EB4]|uniref:Cell division protein ZipA n=1 Tax=Shewanella halifaxensis (strain HAW-EB4) TaxID=458817 RepID=ZIPA_SHEHH|nr:cell division protein ZipA [Shewanella halifaxensis]B0TKB3.1 RecName: Full=Cell division protein ZipA [Shewanella halifaxensis HAW-EB4]ABZ77132.1 cell division protein ZipA [Shewanella halifaxensis HAW-EB4]
MENLQLVLLLIGAIAIIAVLVHGFWSIRKQQPKGYKQGSMVGINRERRDAEGFDNDGIGEVRVVKSTPAEAETSKPDVNEQAPQFIEPVEEAFELSQAPAIKVNKTRVEPSLSAEAPAFTAEAPVQESLFATDEPLLAEPVIEARQAPLDVAPQEPVVDEPKQVATEALGEPQDVLVLHVVAKEGKELSGAELLPCLLTLNFKFGDLNIFHRHEDNAGTGKVLFSMANMVKPGVFDPDNMEQFSTQGVVLFMTLPCYGDALMNFSIMLNSAHQIADDLGGVLLDGGRDEWLESTKQNYIQRIRAQA